MKIIETEYWCLMLPPEWSAEQSEDVVMITDQDGIGELAMTTLIHMHNSPPPESRGEEGRSLKVREHPPLSTAT